MHCIKPGTNYYDEPLFFMFFSGSTLNLFLDELTTISSVIGCKLSFELIIVAKNVIKKLAV